MYTGMHARLRPLQPAFIMASSGEAVTYAELEARCDRLAHLFRNCGLRRLDHYAIFMENNSRYLEACGAGERSGLYFTCVNSYLTPGELAYIVNNSCSRILITSVAKLDVARQALKDCPKVELCIVADGPSESECIVGLQAATSGLPNTPIPDESAGTAMLYSSGTTGRPKGILRPLPGAGEGRHHQMVGTNRPRILWRNRRLGLHRLQQRGVAGPSRHGRPGLVRRPPHSRREHEAVPNGHARHRMVQDRHTV